MKALIADDHPIVRKGIVQLLKDAFPKIKTEEVNSGIEAVKKINGEVWDLIVLDISMPGRNGIEVLKHARNSGVKTPILILSMQAEEHYALRSLKAGASGYVSKESAGDELVKAVERVMKGKKYISPKVTEILAENLGEEPEIIHEKLSDREMEVMMLIASGKAVSDIASDLNLSVSTVSTYRLRILDKLHLHNNAEILRYVFENGLK
ncbi:response regulator transcription factor [Aquiflexum gelatinilyticum]|uniref:Response regulator transcription factor n=1 Tax=Aquiflexum gelatinilyticum TaxID=2961943 RepID=A0A9X2P8J3_9BACT|nr:response regulator transcription factor [Aquiflexum gelatinilyticum]MCR9014080.1 response regulator transcription factor [Aquiflexum gelatinilyticum]MCS4433225.1 response regulator transcription factor [Aquiflexum gelatinilyticum]